VTRLLISPALFLLHKHPDSESYYAAIAAVAATTAAAEEEKA
jgi:hypothetical protein